MGVATKTPKYSTSLQSNTMFNIDNKSVLAKYYESREKQTIVFLDIMGNIHFKCLD